MANAPVKAVAHHTATPAAEVLGTRVHALSRDAAVEAVLTRAGQAVGGAVAFCNVHMVVSARREPALADALQSFELVLPDGAPVAAALRRAGYVGQERVDGPGFMWAACGAAAHAGVGVYFYGSTAQTLAQLSVRLHAAFPELVVAGTRAPQFRPLAEAEFADDLQHIVSSGARLVFVGLGCPRQELWMARARPYLDAVLLGVGAAFDFHAGVKARAPTWMQRAGLEWLHRLAHEPRPLTGRYLVTNSVFLSACARAALARPKPFAPAGQRCWRHS